MIQENIKKYLSFKEITPYKFCKDLGFSMGYLDKNGAIGTDKYLKIIEYYPDINPEWLLTGKGSMIKNNFNNSVINEPSTDYKVLKKIPLVDGTAIGGFGNSKYIIEQRDIKDLYVIPKFQHKKVDFMIEVEGSSMYPKYNSGDVVACRIINERGFIQWNKTHVVATKNQGIILKRIKPGEADSLLMVSDNKDYDPFTVSYEEIDGIALVVGVIRLE